MHDVVDSRQVYAKRSICRRSEWLSKSFYSVKSDSEGTPQFDAGAKIDFFPINTLIFTTDTHHERPVHHISLHCDSSRRF